MTFCFDLKTLDGCSAKHREKDTNSLRCICHLGFATWTRETWQQIPRWTPLYPYWIFDSAISCALDTHASSL